jgi:HEAT repeat protein/energy-coupling factor transporter ATP-binding protein EcfA2
MSRQSEIEQLIEQHKRRLQKLKLKEAFQGINADPSISLEIENIEEKLKDLQAKLNIIFPANNQNKAENIRLNYLKILGEDVRNRLKTSIHSAHFIDIQCEQGLGFTNFPWIYETDSLQSFDCFEEALEHFEKRILLLGAPGSGKTTTLLHYAGTLIRESIANPQAPIPLLFNLSKFQNFTQPPTRDSLSFLKIQSRQVAYNQSSQESDPIGEWLIRLTADYPDVTRDIASSWIKTERVALLLDGLDEFDDLQLINLASQLNDFFRKYPNLIIVICSRIVEYQPLRNRRENRLQIKGSITLQPLNQEQINNYLEKAQATSLRRVLASDAALYEMAKNPLTLSIMTLTYSGMGLAQINIPINLSLWERRQYLFDTYIDRMMQRQSRRKRGIVFDLNPDNDVPTSQYLFSRRQVNRYLGWLAVRMSERMKTGFSLDQLYTFLDQEPDKRFWKMTRIVNGIILILCTFMIGLTLALKASIKLNHLTPTIVIFAILLICCWLAYLATDIELHKSLKYWKQLHLIIFFVKLIAYIFFATIIIAISGSILLSYSILLPFKFSLLSWGAILSSILTAFFCFSINNDLVDNQFTLSDTIKVNLASVLFSFLIAHLNHEIVFSETAFIACFVVIQLSFVSIEMIRKHVGYVDIKSSFIQSGKTISLFLSISLVIFIEWIGTIFLIGEKVDWSEATIFAGLILTFSEMLFVRDFSRVIICCTLIGILAGIFGGAEGTILGIVSTLLLCGLKVFYSNYSAKKYAIYLRSLSGYEDFSEYSSSIADKTEQILEFYIDRPIQRYILNPALKILLSFLGSIPFGYENFLVYATETLFIKQVGKDYEFIHRLLKDHFAIRKLVPNLRYEVNTQTKIKSIQQMSLQGESAFDTLAELLRDANPHIREAAIEGLGRIAIPEVLPVFREALNDSSIVVKLSVVRNLDKLERSDSQSIFKHALSDVDLEVRLAVITQIRKQYILGAGKLLAPLFLKEENVQILHHLIMSCYPFSHQEIKNLLVSEVILIRDFNDPYIFSNIEEIGTYLKKRITPKVVEKLCVFLADHEPVARITTALLLAIIGDRRVVPSLIKRMDDPYLAVRISVAYALGKLGDPLAVETLVHSLHQKLPRSKARIPKDCIKDLYVAIGEAIANIGVGDSTAVLGLLRAFQHPDIKVRVVAIATVGKLQDSSVVPQLLRMLRDMRKSIRKEAVKSLGQFKDPSIVPLLVKSLRDFNASVREESAIALGKIGSESAIPALEKSLRDFNVSVRKESAIALGKIGGKSALSILLNRIQNKNSEVRQSSALGLGEIRDSQAVPMLLNYIQDKNSEVRESVVWTLGQIGDPSALSGLRMVTLDKNENILIRIAALEALSNIKDKSTVTILINVINGLESGNMACREVAVIALGKIGDKSAVPFLIKELQLQFWFVGGTEPPAIKSLELIGTSEAVAAVEKWRQNQEGEEYDEY